MQEVHGAHMSRAHAIRGAQAAMREADAAMRDAEAARSRAVHDAETARRI